MLGLRFGLFYYLAILAKTKYKNMLVWYLEASIDRVKIIREASFPCPSLTLQRGTASFVTCFEVETVAVFLVE